MAITAVLALVATGCLGGALDYRHASLGRRGQVLLAVGLEPLLALLLAVACAVQLIPEVVEGEVVPGTRLRAYRAPRSASLVLTWSGCTAAIFQSCSLAPIEVPA